MGGALMKTLKNCCNKFFNKKIIFQIRICGPAQSGKTTFVKYLLLNEFTKVKPTEGLFIERIDYDEFSIILWDSRYNIEDSMSINRLDIDAVIFFIDISDRGRLKIAKKGFHKILQDFNHIDNFLILASKEDKKNCMSLEEIRSALKINQIVDRNCQLRSCSSKTGHGIESSMNWLVNQLMIKRKKHRCL